MSTWVCMTSSLCKFFFLIKKNIGNSRIDSWTWYLKFSISIMLKIGLMRCKIWLAWSSPDMVNIFCRYLYLLFHLNSYSIIPCLITYSIYLGCACYDINTIDLSKKVLFCMSYYFSFILFILFILWSFNIISRISPKSLTRHFWSNN